MRPSPQFSPWERVIFSLSVFLTCTGCGGGSAPTPPIIVSVSPSSASLQTAATTGFTAVVTNDPGSKGVTWSISCGSAPCGSVSPTNTASGATTTYAAPANPPASDLKVTLTATSVADSTKSAAAIVTIAAITVAVAPSTATVQVGAIVQLSATVGSDTANAGVGWAVSCSAVPCGSISPATSASGDPVTYTAPVSLPASNLSVTVTTTSVTDKTKSSSASLTVPAVAVSVAPAVATVVGGSSAPFIATVLGDSTNKGVT